VSDLANPAPILRKLDGDGDALEILYNLIGPARAAALAADARLGRIRTLVLHDNRLGDEGLAALLRSPHLVSLERLAVRRNGLGAAGLAALAAWPRLASVRALDLAENPLGDGLAHLAASPHLGTLRVLGLAGCEGRFDALLDLPVLEQLNDLDLTGTGLSDRHRTVFDWEKHAVDQVVASDLAVALRRRLGPRLKV
jgi:hypothetical protein